ncbi:GntR family transcriptional regulator [Salinibacterium amurskyense]|uniref:GntR family transcriptional regulator n=1 Tax=Salinibacterium amurskyense TaxID=205941 RepID=UPI00311F8B80
MTLPANKDVELSMSTARGTSKYVAVREHLLTRVQGLEPGARLPSEPQLCDEYGVSRITLRHAVDGLISDGYLVREQGRGTFVVEPQYRTRYRERFADAVTGFHAQQTSDGFDVTTSVVELAEFPAGEPTASQLGINSADRVARLTRVRSVNGTLHHLAVTNLPLAQFPDILDENFTDASLFSYLSDAYGVALTRNDLLVSIKVADEFIAEHLNVEPGEHLLAVASTVFDADDRAVSYGMAYFTPQNSEIAFGLHS